MQPISRHEMERRLKRTRVVHSAVEQDRHEIRIRLELENRETCLVKYDLLKRTKDYLYSENL